MNRLLPADHKSPPRSRAFTLIEMLVSLAITLIMMSAVVSLFGLISDTVSGSRAVIEVSERLRATRNRLQADLLGVTATMRPPLRPGNDEGYFELIEGPDHDEEFVEGLSPDYPRDTAMGDTDDVLMFTTRSRGEPFVGKFNGTTVESQVAEVMYFCDHATDAAGLDTDPVLYFNGTIPVRLYTLYRRVLLVVPGLNSGVAFPLADPDFFDENDISARVGAATTQAIPNTLGDLTKRENRFAHHPNPGTTTGFPFDLLNTGAPPPPGFGNSAELRPFDGPRLGDDVLLTNVLSFDVQVYDPGAPVDVQAGFARTPEDPNYDYNPAPLTAPTVFGAYANLGSDHYLRADYPDARFSVDPTSPIPLTIRPGATAPPPLNLQPFGLTDAYTYDTWSLHYENNGQAENADDFQPSNTARVNVDAATNGLDDDGNGIVDDAVIVDPATGQVIGGEAETVPPFLAPLRGIRVRIRVYEPDSRQIRQVTIVQDFLPD